MKPRIGPAFSVLALSILAATATARADAIPDQTSLPATLLLSSGLGGSIQQAQTFRAGLTGTLVEIDILGFGFDGFLFDIRGLTDSHPDNSNVLETVAVAGFAPTGSFTRIPLDLPVTQDERLAFVVYATQGLLYGAIDSSYADGSLWTFGNPPFGVDGPGTWYPNGASPNMNFDLAFRTFVDIPEPATVGVLLAGLAAIGARRRRATPAAVARPAC